MDHADKQGGKLFGAMKDQQRKRLNSINKKLRDNDDYKEEEDLDERLVSYADKYMGYDLNDQGEIDEMALKRILEDMGQAKTHMEIRKMIQEVDTTDSGAISYMEFLELMFGKKNTVLSRILKFEEFGKEKPKPTGPPKKKTFADLP